jgi:hypothetical protein
MALEYYDDVIAAKIKKWLPSNSGLRVLKPDETKRFFELQANDNNDRPLQLPCIALSRNTDIDLLINVKNQKSFMGHKVGIYDTRTLMINTIPIKLQYQLDIYTKTATEGDEYLRQYLFKLINNPSFKIVVPYNGADIEQIANIRVLTPVSDTSSIAERLFPGQFTRWTIQLEIMDAFLYDVPYKRNWKLYLIEQDETSPVSFDEYSILEAASDLNSETEAEITELVEVNFQKE